LTRDGKKEITRVTADRNGNYRVELPPGINILDVKARTPNRPKPQPFAGVSNQTVRVDMGIDTGIRQDGFRYSLGRPWAHPLG
jgi:hypothetical protein